MSAEEEQQNETPGHLNEAHQQDAEMTEFERLQRLVEFLKQAGVVEYTSERESELGARKLSLKFAGAAAAPAIDPAIYAQLMAQQGSHHAAAPAQAAPQAASAAAPSAAPAAASEADEEASWHIVKSPIVGTFYESPSPGASAFVQMGDRVDNGQVLCIVEAMKLMNEIESDGAGVIVKQFVRNGQPVEYGQKLFALKG